VSKTLFEKIVAREIPAEIIYEDDLVLSIRDINPQAPTHILILPNRHLPAVSQAQADDLSLLGTLLLVGKQLAEKENLVRGYRLVINEGEDAGQTVAHLHVHLLGGRGCIGRRDRQHPEPFDFAQGELRLARPERSTVRFRA